MNQFFYTQVPKAASPLLFGRNVDAQLSACLKNKNDHVILDVSAVEHFENAYVGVLTRWLRNLKSVGGSLSFTGVHEEVQMVLRRAKLVGACETFKTLDDFKTAHPEARIEVDPLLEEDKGDVDGSESVPTAVEENPVVIPEGPMRDFLDESYALHKLKDIDVSDQLDFLAEHPGLLESQDIIVDLNFQKKAFSEESDPRLIFEEDAVDSHELFEEQDLDLDEALEYDQVETIHKIPLGEKVVDSGEYQCLGCGERDYFLTQQTFGKCVHSECHAPSAGWHLVCKLF